MQVYPASAGDRLGFTQVVEKLDSLLISEPGRDRLGNMRPAADVGWLRSELSRVDALQRVLRFDDPVPFEPMPDVRPQLRRAAPEDAYLDPLPLYEVGQFLGTARRLHGYFGKRKEAYAALWALMQQLVPLEEIERGIARAVDPDGSVRDDASDDLRRIRVQMTRRQAQLRETLMRELRRAISEGWATEEQPTIRNGRMVIPVRAEARRKVQGFVHDTSATGQTVYIEPAASLDLNNELRELQSEERREVERILRQLTAEVRAHLESIRGSVRILAAIDLLQAKARFGNELDAVIPAVDTHADLQIIKGRNPVLELHFRRSMAAEEARARIVPLDLTLGRDYHTLVVTGPNAGGKTVAMKTVGLFALMAACGLPVPADEKTTIPLFDAVMVDIGDQQSIEEDLSTFSSHITNLRHMIEHATDRSLTLIDEAGTGTDPDEGGALARAVLEVLNTRGTRTIATTHHGALKAFAHTTEGVENGSMAFDRETLSPTYQFVAGVPGSSYAFDIARRTGLPTDILERARELIGETQSGLEDLIGDFERRSQDLERRLAEVEKTERRVDRLREEYDARRRRFDEQRDEMRGQAVAEAERIVREANARVERTIREIKEAEAEREATKEARQSLEDFREKLGRRTTKRRRPAQAPVQETSPRGTVAVGDQVVIDGGTSVAEVLEMSGKNALVALGAMKMRVKADRLTRVGGKRKQQVTVRQVASGEGSLAALQARTRIDLRGMRVDEALGEVQRFIDDAIRTNQQRIEILHGKGTGALREATHDLLATMPEVTSFEEAPIEEGGAGVTIVFL